jgi:hypothetical protein
MRGADRTELKFRPYVALASLGLAAGGTSGGWVLSDVRGADRTELKFRPYVALALLGLAH